MRSSAVPRADSITTGVSPARRIASRTVRPSTSGSMMSSTTSAGGGLADAIQGAAAVAGTHHGEAGPLQVERHQADDLGIVVHDQDRRPRGGLVTVCGGVAWASTGSAQDTVTAMCMWPRAPSGAGG